MEWQPIETAPKDGTYILAIVAGNHPSTGLPYVPDVVLFRDGFWLVSDGYQDEYDDENWKPTHWMPIPPPPGDDQ